MFTDIWLGDPELYSSGGKSLEPPTDIIHVRRMEHSDLPILEQLIRLETCDIFGEVNLGHIYEASCFSIVQCNEKRDIVSGMCLCNYPNVPSVIPQDWPSWLDSLYRIENVTERNAAFVHFLVWDKRYTSRFYQDLLTGVFNVTSYLHHVILVLPPQVIPGDVIEGQMIRIKPKRVADSFAVQSLYVSSRHLHRPSVNIRRIVEEDNDDLIPIIDNESSLMKEFYGEYYISEMVRYPCDYRKLIVCEAASEATGIMFLNRAINVDTLNENFELVLYNGLRKPHEEDEIPPESFEPPSETFISIFSRRFHDELISGAKVPFTIPTSRSSEEEDVSSSSSTQTPDWITAKIASVDPQALHFLSGLPSIGDHLNSYKSMRHTDFDSMFFDIPRKTTIRTLEEDGRPLVEESQFPPRPIYRGKRNAFALEIFTMKDSIKQYGSRNFLQAAFECFPDLDYCIILLPFSHPFLFFLKYFVRVPVRCIRDFSMSLYVTHRAALRGEVKTREAVPNDLLDVQELLQKIPKSETILADFEEAMAVEDRSKYCYVFQWNQRIIGLAVLCDETDAMKIKRRYHVEDYVSTMNVPWDAYGRILHFVLTPIFAIHLPFFFNEIMRLSGLTVLYYLLTGSALSALSRSQPLAICLTCMSLVPPRDRIKYKFFDYLETDEPEASSEYFSVFMTSPRLTMLDNLHIDMKIVVVGASDCGIAFLEHLALGTVQDSSRFINLTLISPNGLPFENERSYAVANMVPFRGRYCREYRRLVATRAWINVVYGTVSAIDRQEKFVTVSRQGNITYDYLILACGLQYQRPIFQMELEAQRKGELAERETPWNCLSINDDAEATSCLEKIQLLTNDFEDEKKIIVYGNNIDCYCTLQALLESGIEGSWITLIQPPLQEGETHETPFFNNCEIYVEVMNAIVRSGVKILVDWKLVDWRLMRSTEGKMIETIILQSKKIFKMMDCDILINFYEKTINMKIFLAICRSGLVFDGQLVIDPEFRTNDPCVFAAGTVTKYRRKYYAESWEHKYYNSIEIGERLAKLFRSIVEQEQRLNGNRPPAAKSKPYLKLPIFRLAKIVVCVFPGNYRYLHVYKPGKIVTREIAINHKLYGEVMITGSTSSEIGYFRIRLNTHNTVESITCLHKEDFEYHHLIKLYGKHESLLNELKTRFNQSLISDFYAYFREPWAMALFYDRFQCLRVENRATLLSKTAIPGNSLVEDCVEALMQSKWESMSECDRQCISSRYAGSVYQQELEESLLDFLQFAAEDLPVYCMPRKLRELYADIEDSPLYTDF